MARILVVDDDDGVRALIEDVLRIANYEVDTAATVKAALPLFERNDFAAAGNRTLTRHLATVNILSATTQVL